MAAPTFVADEEGSAGWDSTTTPKTTASFSVLANDVLVALVGAADSTNTTLDLVSGGSLTWANQKSVSATNYGPCRSIPPRSMPTSR
jgi:hypothetical protein